MKRDKISNKLENLYFEQYSQKYREYKADESSLPAPSRGMPAPPGRGRGRGRGMPAPPGRGRGRSAPVREPVWVPRYRRMERIGLSKDAVINAMIRNGLSEADRNLYFEAYSSNYLKEASSPTKAPAKPKKERMPRGFPLEKYQKLLEAGESPFTII